jgi:hypothetical protein
MPRSKLKLTQVHTRFYWRFFPRENVTKVPWREANHSLPIIIEINHVCVWRLIPTLVVSPHMDIFKHEIKFHIVAVTLIFIAE